MECNPFGSIEQALEDLAAGKMIIVTDDEDRENEGDIIVSCKFASPQTVNFIAKNAWFRGAFSLGTKHHFITGCRIVQ